MDKIRFSFWPDCEIRHCTPSPRAPTGPIHLQMDSLREKQTCHTHTHTHTHTPDGDDAAVLDGAVKEVGRLLEGEQPVHIDVHLGSRLR